MYYNLLLPNPVHEWGKALCGTRETREQLSIFQLLCKNIPRFKFREIISTLLESDLVPQHLKYVKNSALTHVSTCACKWHLTFKRERDISVHRYFDFQISVWDLCIYSNTIEENGFCLQFNKKVSQVSHLHWIIHRTCCQQFSSALFLWKKIVPIKKTVTKSNKDTVSGRTHFFWFF